MGVNASLAQINGMKRQNTALPGLIEPIIWSAASG